MPECQKIAAAAEAAKLRAPGLGTLSGLIEYYFAREHFLNLADATERDYRACAAYLAPIRDTQVHLIDPPLVSGIYDMTAKKLGWRRGNYVLTFISQVSKFARPSGSISSNPAEGVIQKPRPRDAGYANQPWTVQEDQIVMEAASPALCAALSLMVNTGLDPSDAIRLRRDALSNGIFRGFRAKTRGEIAVPVGRRFEAALDAAPVHTAVTILGIPWPSVDER